MIGTDHLHWDTLKCHLCPYKATHDDALARHYLGHRAMFHHDKLYDWNGSAAQTTRRQAHEAEAEDMAKMLGELAGQRKSLIVG